MTLHPEATSATSHTQDFEAAFHDKEKLSGLETSYEALSSRVSAEVITQCSNQPLDEETRQQLRTKLSRGSFVIGNPYNF